MSSQTIQPSSLPPMQVVIGMCTFRRYDDLKALLTSISQLKVADNITLSVVVVDNEPTPAAHDVVAAAGSLMPWPVRYVHEPEPGIPFARNRVLHEAGTEGFLAFLDDDETVDPNWLQALVEAQVKTSATFVQGPVVMSVPQEKDAWWLRSAFFLQNSFDDLAPIKESWTNNVLVDLAFVSRHGLRFDEALRFEGGEDTLFFQDIVARGGEGRFACKALVYEIQPPDRLSWRWGMKRQYRYGITRAKTALRRRTKRAATLYCMVRGSAMIGIGLCKLPLAIIRGRVGLAGSAALVSRGIGVFAGYFGSSVAEYGSAAKVAKPS